MRTFDYSITYEFDGITEPVHVKGSITATTAATASARAIRETLSKGKRAGSIVVVLTPKAGE